MVLPQYDPILEANFPKFLAALLDSLVVSLLVTVLIGSVVFWLTPKILKKSVMDVIGPKEISPLLKKSATDTRNWAYKGACGRYMRAKTLPTLARSAKNEGLSRDIQITILNPNNDQSCTEYATYRSSLKSAKNSSPWTAIKVKEEVIATIVSVWRFSNEEPLLQIDLFLATHFSAFRLDISDHYLIVTKEDNEASALRADSGTYFYDSFKDDIKLIQRQSINRKFSNKVPHVKTLTEDVLRNFIIENEIINREKIIDLNLETMCRLINLPKDPYS